MRSLPQNPWAVHLLRPPRAFYSTALLLVVVLALCVSPASGQANEKLQIHFIDVGQGDAAVLISPQGEIVLFDNGLKDNCDKPISYLQQLGVTKIDYHVASHYHADHIGCAVEVLGQFPLQKSAFDRGGSYKSGTYDNYILTVGSKRVTATPGTTFTLDATSANPVVITIAAANAATVDGPVISTTNENDLSVVAHIKFGEFDAEIGGDLSGFKTGSYEDIETDVSGKVGEIEVYKVHHHGSAYSTNDTWLAITKPIIGIVSTGNGNTYGHPTRECLERLHAAGVKTYWTEIGAGTSPEPGQDVVGGNIIVQVEPGSSTFTVTYDSSHVDTYAFHGAPPAATTTMPKYAWSKKSSVYHYANCRYVENISPENLQRGDTPPQGKHLHEQCPK